MRNFEKNFETGFIALVQFLGVVLALVIAGFLIYMMWDTFGTLFIYYLAAVLVLVVATYSLGAVINRKKEEEGKIEMTDVQKEEAMKKWLAYK